MRVVLCDLCKKRIKEPDTTCSFSLIGNYGFSMPEKHICQDCAYSIKGFIFNNLYNPEITQSINDIRKDFGFNPIDSKAEAYVEVFSKMEDNDDETDD